MKQITIYDIIPLLKSGWVCCTNCGAWWWFAKKPEPIEVCGFYDHRASNFDCLSDVFNIAPFDGDWKDSLIKIEHKDEEVEDE